MCLLFLFVVVQKSEMRNIHHRFTTFSCRRLVSKSTTFVYEIVLCQMEVMGDRASREGIQFLKRTTALNAKLPFVYTGEIVWQQQTE